MTVYRKPPPTATLGTHRLSATWAVIRKRKIDPEYKGFLRLSIRSTEEVLIAYNINLRCYSFVEEFDFDRKGVWLFLLDRRAAKAGAKNFSPWRNQTRCNFHSTAGTWKGMGTERHDVQVEVWTLIENKRKYVWLFAPLKYVENLRKFKGPTLLKQY